MIGVPTSSRAPDIPTASRTPSCPSTTKPRGITWMTSESLGMEMLRAASMTRSTSRCVISRSPPATATTPRLLMDFMCGPARPAKTPSTRWPDIRSAARTAPSIARTVFSRFTITPLRRPSAGTSPTPEITSSPSPVSDGVAMTQHTLVLPMSRPTILPSLLIVSGSPPPSSHTLGESLWPARLARRSQELPPDHRDVLEYAHAEGKDRGEVKLHAQLVAQECERPGDCRVGDQAREEDRVLVAAVERSLERAEYRVQRRQQHHRRVARIGDGDLNVGLDAHDNSHHGGQQDQQDLDHF